MGKKLKSFSNFLNETFMASGNISAVPGIAQTNALPNQKESLAQKKKRLEQEAIEKLTPKSLHGLDPTPEHEASVRGLLTQYSDNPETPEVEAPKDASWQSINTAQANYMQQELQKLKAQQGMAR